MHSVMHLSASGGEPFLGGQEGMETFNTCIVLIRSLIVKLGTKTRCDICTVQKSFFYLIQF